MHGFNVRITSAAEPQWPYAKPVATLVSNVTLVPGEKLQMTEFKAPADYPHILKVEFEEVLTDEEQDARDEAAYEQHYQPTEGDRGGPGLPDWYPQGPPVSGVLASDTALAELRAKLQALPVMFNDGLGIGVGATEDDEDEDDDPPDYDDDDDEEEEPMPGWMADGFSSQEDWADYQQSLYDEQYPPGPEFISAADY